MKNMFTKMLVALALIAPLSTLAAGKIQDADVKSLADIQGAVLTTTANLSGGNQCITSPGSVAGLVTGLFVYDVTTPANIASAVTIIGLPGSCSAGQIKISVAAVGTATGDTLRFGGQMSQLINDTKLYVTANGINSQLSTAITNGLIGSSGGSKNYLAPYVASTSGGTSNAGNGNFEKNATSGFSLFNTTLTGVIPTGSISAGAASITTFATTGTNALSGKYSLNVASSGAITAGQGYISDAFFIDSSDQAKVLAFSASYSVISGLANLNLSGTSSNTFAAYLYDVTNSAWIQPAGVYNMVQGSSTGKWVGTFQTSSNGSQYRLAFLAVNASGGAASVYWDDLSVGPQTSANAPAVSDWKDFSPTGSWTSNATYTGKWRRVGDTMEIQTSVSLSGAPNASPLTINIPSGYSMDLSKLTQQASSVSPYFGGGSGTSAGNLIGYWTTYGSATNVWVLYQSSTTGIISGTDNATPFTYASGDHINIKYSVPIVGWSSNTVSSADTDTRVVSMSAYNVNISGTPSNAQNVAVFSSVQIDTHGGYNTTTGLYTCPVSGLYDFTANIPVVATYTANVNSVIAIRKNGTDLFYETENAASTSTTALRTKIHGIVQCNAGDTLAPSIGTNGVSPSYNTGGISNENQLSIKRLSGPAVIQANSVISMTAKNSSTSIPNGADTTIVYGTVEGDSTNSYNSSTGVYTVPIAGDYEVSAFALFTSFSASAGATIRMGVTLNGAVQRYLDDYQVQATQNFNWYSHGSTILKSLKAGDTITTTQFQNSGSSRSLSGDSSRQYMSIARLGGI